MKQGVVALWEEPAQGWGQRQYPPQSADLGKGLKCGMASSVAKKGTTQPAHLQWSHLEGGLLAWQSW